jgi:hemerythrin-like metal-binding protein
MPLVQWKESYSLKNAALDTQHKKLFKILNKLYEEFMGGITDLAYETALDNIIAFTKYHFQTEEHVMHKIKHPHSYHHKQEHLRFSEQIHELKNSTGRDVHEKSNELIKFLVNWILHHIVVEDRKIIHP